jgi:hypothetical protein
MPQDGEVDTANIHYRSHWTISGNMVGVHREVHAHCDTALCSAVALRETRDAITRIRVDYESGNTLSTRPDPAVRRPPNPAGPYTGRQG